MLLGGDAGVGKSRLLAELVDNADATVLTGRCLDVGEGGLPYLPFVEALGRLDRSLLERRPVLGRLLPGVAAGEPDTGDQAAERLRMFDAVHGLLRTLSAERPVILALEDLHWADASTRDLVLFLLSRLDGQRLLVVATYRTDDLHRRHPLWRLLAELTRLPAVARLELAPFEKADAVAFVSALAGGDLPEDAIEAVAERAQGNAFFCEELIAAYRGGTVVSSGLAELLLARMERLGPDAQRVVRTVSGAGYTVPDATLREVSGMDEPRLEEALREALRHNILVADDDGYAFRHALLREAVYEDLLPGERVRLHAKYAGAATEAAALAYHAFRSHDLPSALAASVRAASRAEEMRAPGEALAHVEQALQLWEVVPEPAKLAGTGEIRLLLRASMLAGGAGEPERSASYARSAVAKADLAGDPEVSAAARHQLALALRTFGAHGDEISAVADEAWELVRGLPPSVTRAEILALLARRWVWTPHDQVDVRELYGYAEQAIDEARQVGADAVEVDALVTLAVFAEWEARTGEAIRIGDEAVQRARAIGAVKAELRARHNLAVHHAIEGHHQDAIRIGEENCRRGEEAGLAWSDQIMHSRADVVYLLYLTGEWARGLATADLPGAPRLPWARVSAETLFILIAQGRFDEAGRLVDRVLELSPDPRTRTVVDIALAEAAATRERYEEAVARARDALTGLTDPARPVVIDALWITTIAISALAEVGGAEAVAAGEELYARAGKYDRRVQHERALEWRVLSSRMDAELSRLRGHDDPGLWRVVVQHAEGAPYWQAMANRRLAASLLAADEREAAAEPLRAAYEAADRLGAVPLRDAVVALGRRARIAVGAPVADDVLTPRERSVLELVAGGLTNKQIGARLYISEKTASVHLSRVMAKLGAASRAEAVSVAHQRGLLTG